MWCQIYKCLYFCGPEEYSVETQQKVLQHILERNQISREVAAAKGVPLLDLFAALDTERLADFRQDFFDVLHPRPAAYQKIAAAIYEGMGIMPPASP